jgi:hypothetical protein
MNLRAFEWCFVEKMGLELLSKQLEIQMLVSALNQLVTDQVTE